MGTVSKRSPNSNTNVRQILLFIPRHQPLPLVSYPGNLPLFSFLFFFYLVFVSLIMIRCAQVFGPSMLPTLNLTGDVILAEYVSHRVGRLGPGDIVFVRSPVDPNKIVTKRIVGVEGDRVTYFKPRNGDSCHTVVVRTFIFSPFILIYFNKYLMKLVEAIVFCSSIVCVMLSLELKCLVRSQRGMFGYKGITFMLPGIRGNLGLFRMVLLKGKHFSG